MTNESLFSSEPDGSLTKVDIVFAVIYSLIVLPGIVGNCIILIILWKNSSMHTTTNYLLMNLAVADLITLLLCPGLYDFAITKVHLQGITGDLICKLFVGNAIVPITINTAVLTVCTIAVERYMALVKPFRTAKLTKESVKYVIAVLWLLALLSCIPDIQANTYDISSTKYPCKRPWSLDEYFFHKPFIIFTCVGFGLMSSSILIFCYFEIIRGLYFTRTICSESTCNVEERKAKKQLARLVIWLAVVFAACSLPFSIYFIFLISADIRTVKENYNVLFELHRATRFLLFSNSFFNPLLYALQSSNYRDGFKLICNVNSGLLCCKREHVARSLSLTRGGETLHSSQGVFVVKEIAV
ncbi:tachykinin-like peptides receptor 86C [Stylophora pistillata]|uniref:tachykinin-like peptides receptor 86C n=1 Tax=Stylophora pistillata TaxID=50429 RepID=UPI000C052D13|nr:tachykinin-like peptides receptor 86C [Stylophora pistillata]XP_022789621.1 tachykinin-like peptides receptor 86C [Stylophora pistillata]